MAKLSSALLIVLATASGAWAETMPVTPPAEALDAYKNYWQNFDLYEKKVFDDKLDKFQSSWKELSERRESTNKQLNETQVKHLEDSEKKYRDLLEKHAGASNTPYVYLNLAQTLSRLADHYSKEDDDKAENYRNEALQWIDQLKTKHPEFSAREETLYLEGYVLTQEQRFEQADRVWRQLSQTSGKTIYGVHASLAVGDHYFKRDEAKQALDHYQKALKVLNQLDIPQKDYEKLRVQYRIIWASYRAAELRNAVSTGIELLTPGRATVDIQQKEKIQADAVDLLGDALYENNNLITTKRTLQRKEIAFFVPAIGYRVMKNYLSVNAREQALELGEFLAEHYPVAKETPEILTSLAETYDALKKDEQKIAALEKLALLLPPQSLWRTRHRQDYKALERMEALSFAGGLAAAGYYYQKGMASGNIPAYMSAVSLYDMLLQFNPTHTDANEYRLRIAHGYYFADQLEKAEEQYMRLKTDHKLSEDHLQITSYQLVVTREKRWRHAFSQAIGAKRDPSQDAIVVERLRKLEGSIEEYANRFPNDGRPGSGRAVDLLLIGAASNRDHENFRQASKFWERALVSNPNSSQRAVAIRGLVLTSVRTGKPKDVIQLTTRFLANEPTEKWEPGLSVELKGVLAQALQTESARLNQEGDVLGAGNMLVETCERFNDLPQWDKLYRDGAYHLAIAGEWARAQEATNYYFRQGKHSEAADMAYLQARSLEYQLRFDQAAKAFLVMGERYSRHPKTLASLEKAEKLAVAENELTVASRAAMLLAQLSDNNEAKKNAYERAITYYEQQGKPSLALETAQKRLALTNDSGERLQSELLLAKTKFDAKREQEALKAFEVIARKAEGQRSQLEPEVYSAIAGESNFYLGEEHRARFEDFSLVERRGTVQQKLGEKMKMFETLTYYYDKAAKVEHHDWSSKSRYLIGEAAEHFANELQALPQDERISVSNEVRSHLEEAAKKLRAIAKRAHSSNVLAASGDKKKFRDNVWVKKSNLKISGMAGSQAPQSPEPLPPATGHNMSSQWSL